MMTGRWRAVLVGFSVVLMGCAGTRSGLRSRIPKQPDQFAQKFLDVLLDEDFEAAREMLRAPLRPADMGRDNEEIARLVGQGSQVDRKAVGYHQFVFDPDGTRLRTSLDYQIHFERSWLVVTVDVETREGEQAVTNIRVNKLDVPLEEQNVLRVTGLKLGHYVFFGIACVVLLASLVAAITCLVAGRSRKLLWILVILTGFGSVRMNWTTGERRYELLTLQFPSVHISQPNPYSPWTVSLGLPLGVVLFVLHRRRLKRRRAAAPARPAKAVPPPAREQAVEPLPPTAEPKLPEPEPSADEEPEDSPPREEEGQ